MSIMTVARWQSCRMPTCFEAMLVVDARAPWRVADNQIATIWHCDQASCQRKNYADASQI